MSSTEITSNALILDQSKIGGEGSEVYIFQFLSNALRAVKVLSTEEMKPHLSAFESTLVSIMLSASPFTAPAGRPIRSLITKCFMVLYGKEDAKGLFDTVNKMLVAAGDIKEKEAVRVSAFFCAGELMGAYGYQVMSFMAELVIITTKTYKLTSAAPFLRYHALEALGKALQSAGRTLTDPMVKDLQKNMRVALLDRALPVQRAACSVLIGLFPKSITKASNSGHAPSTAVLTLSDIDSLMTQIMKSLDNPEGDNLTRLSLAKLTAHILSSTQIPRAVTSSILKPGQSSATPQSQEEGTGPGGAKSQPEIVAKPLMQPYEMLEVLSVWMSKQTSSRRQRVGIIHSYHMLFNSLGASWVETHYSLILRHLAKNVMNTPKVLSTSKAERAWTRQAVGILLRDVIGERMLGEQGLITAVIECVNSFLRPYLSAILYAKSNARTSLSQEATSGTSSFIKSQSEKPPSPDSLMVVLKEIAGLLHQLGNAPPVVQELLGGGEVLIAVACSTAGNGVRGATVQALCAFVRACPIKMGGIMEALHEGLKRDITTLETLASQASASSSNALPSLNEVKSRALGHAYCMYGIYSLMALTDKTLGGENSAASAVSQSGSTAASLHLYLPPISPTLFQTATSLLKSTLDQPLPIARINSEIGWTVLSGLMALGPQFIRANLSSLMVLWRNALPKPTVRDNSSTVGKEEWGFLLSVRGWAVGAIGAFLRWNNQSGANDPKGGGIVGAVQSTGTNTLVTLDISRRLGTLLFNALGFANLFITNQKEEVPDPTSPSGTSISMLNQVDEDGFDLLAYEALLRSRIHVAFSLLGFHTVTESIQRELITSTISLFAGPDSYAGSGLQTAIAAKEGTFKGVWKCEDGFAYGVTSIALDEVSQGGGPDSTMAGTGSAISGGTSGYQGKIGDTVEIEVDKLLVRPIIGSTENDTLLAATPNPIKAFFHSSDPVPAATAVVNSAIELFALLLCSQDSNGASKALSGLVDTARGAVDKAATGPRMAAPTNIGRKMAISINSIWALVTALRMVMDRGVSTRTGREVFGGAHVSNIVGDFLKESILDADETIRIAASEAMGRLCSMSSTTFLGTQVNNLVKEVVNNRDPNARAGCASTFGSIFTHAGGLAGQPYLKTVLNVLMSLGNDPHPVVHYGALTSLAQIVSSSSMSYGPYVSSTLRAVLRFYLLDTHEPEGGSVVQANLSGDLPTYEALCRIIDGVISAIGPEIQDSVRSRTLILDLVYEFLEEEEDAVRVAAIQCLRQLLMFAPSTIDVPRLVTFFKECLGSQRHALKEASINALYQLVQRDAFMLSKVGGDKLVEVLFGMLDQDDSASIEGVRNIIVSWLTQTVSASPSAWIDLCQRIMARTTASSQQQAVSTTKKEGFHDEESESLGASVPGNQNEDQDRSHLAARWRTQLFAMECLHKICTTIVSSGRREHLDLRYAKQHGIPTKGLLANRIPDLIKMAFTSSAAYVTEIRLSGLLVLKDVVEIFSSSPDPDYDDALLLEQHQAPITAALTPAFSSDSTPELLAFAVQVCAIFVGSGVIKDVSKMGRILKLLTGALDQSKTSGSFAIGEVQQMSPNAAVMLKISTLTAWAELQIASTHQNYLKAVILPYQETLASLWVGALRDYASIRGDTEVLQEATSSAVDTLYLNLGKEVLLPYYDKSWYKILKATSVMMESRSPYIVAAMDGREGESAPSAFRSEPAALFFVVFGLVFEALTQSSGSNSSTTEESVTITALESLEHLVRPEYAGSAILEATIFDEFTSLCYRLAMMETANVHIPLIRTITSLASTQLGHANKRSNASDMSSQVQLTHCLRICAYILRRALPSTSGGTYECTQETRISLLKTAFDSLIQLGTLYGPESRGDMGTISVALYSELLKDEAMQYDLVGPTLPALKKILATAILYQDKSDSSRLVQGLISCCLQNIEETSNRSGISVDMKAKNNMFAVVLILTCLPPDFTLSRALVDECCYLIGQKINDGSDNTLAATQCAKTLITGSLAPSSNPALKYCAGLLLPKLIQLVALAAANVDDSSRLSSLSPPLDEALKTFTAFFTGIPEHGKSAALAVILPTLALLLDPSRSPPSSLHIQTVPILLSFATSAPGPFKEITDKLDPAVREVLEQSVRQAIAGHQQATASQVAAKPQISLKAF